MEYDISYIFIIIASNISLALFYLKSKGVLILTIVSIILVLLFILYIYNSLSKREKLNILKNDDTLYFYLSDDYLFSTKLSKDDNLSDILFQTIKAEMATIKEIVSGVDFINFKDDVLKQKLNALIQANIH